MHYLLKILAKNQFELYPFYEKLTGDLSGAFSRHVNHQHRLIYSVHSEQKVAKINQPLHRIGDSPKVCIECYKNMCKRNEYNDV
ncbi:MAG: type II toxin-antitoxin system YoeB family toxin [Caldisericia bacterium]|nr:type II toxin-antitoxin system YoeB family toxin [Caldisericia bacterium]